MVKNESDIIEAFIRYHVNIFDSMFIVDNNSTDGTQEIIQNLKSEGLPIKLLFDDNPSFDQSQITTNLFYSVLEWENPDYVIPLDVDEFLTNERNYFLELQTYINNLPSFYDMFYISWRTYVPTVGDNIYELNPLKKLSNHRKKEHNHEHKIILCKSILENRKIIIKQGNHNVIVVEGDSRIKTLILDDLRLAHYPIRSVSQAKSKYLVGWIANLAREKQVLFDWLFFYNLIKEGGELDQKSISEMGLLYGIKDKELAVKIIDSPLSLPNNFSLRYKNLIEVDSFKNLLSYCELMARKYSILLSKYNKTNYQHYEVSLESYHVIKDFTLLPGELNVYSANYLYSVSTSFKYKNENVSFCILNPEWTRSLFILIKSIRCYEKVTFYFIFDPKNENLDTFLSKLKSAVKENVINLATEVEINLVPKYHDLPLNCKIDLFLVGNSDSYQSLVDSMNYYGNYLKSEGVLVFYNVGILHDKSIKQYIEREIVVSEVWKDFRLVDNLYFSFRR